MRSLTTRRHPQDSDPASVRCSFSRAGGAPHSHRRTRNRMPLLVLDDNPEPFTRYFPCKRDYEPILKGRQDSLSVIGSRRQIPRLFVCRGDKIVIAAFCARSDDPVVLGVTADVKKRSRHENISLIPTLYQKGEAYRRLALFAINPGWLRTRRRHPFYISSITMEALSAQHDPAFRISQYNCDRHLAFPGCSEGIVISSITVPIMEGTDNCLIELNGVRLSRGIVRLNFRQLRFYAKRFTGSDNAPPSDIQMNRPRPGVIQCQGGYSLRYGALVITFFSRILLKILIYEACCACGPTGISVCLARAYGQTPSL